METHLNYEWFLSGPMIHSLQVLAVHSPYHGKISSVVLAKTLCKNSLIPLHKDRVFGIEA